jgi:hypothetical protein
VFQKDVPVIKKVLAGIRKVLEIKGVFKEEFVFCSFGDENL